MIYYSLLLSIFIWPFGQLLTLNNSFFPGTLYLLDISLALLTLACLCSTKLRKNAVKDKIFWPLVLFLSVATLSLLVNSFRLTQANLVFSISYLIRLFIYPSAYFAIKNVEYSRTRTPLLISFSLFCIFGILQYILLPDMRFLKLIGFDDHYYRLIGTLFDPNFTGAILGAAALSSFAFSNWIVGIILLFVMAPTFSRGSYLSFSTGIIFLFIKQRKVLNLLLLFLLAVVIVLIPKPFGEGVNLWRTFSIFSRIESWGDGISLAIEKPFLGWGYNTLRSITGDRFQIDNSYIYIAATTGLLGLTSFLYLLYKSIRSVKILPGLLFLLSLLFHSLFNNSFFYIWIFLSFWMVLGLSTREYK